MYFGAHVSIAGGLTNAPKNSAALGCEVFQIFTRSPQGGFVAPLNKKLADEFRGLCKEYNQKEWVVHAPYFINFASANPRIKHGSITVVREELERASLLGAAYVMAHLGSYKDLGEKEGLTQLVDGLEKMLNGYKGSAQFLIEISAGAGAIIGDTFEEIAEIINHKKLKKYDIGVCYDTQHGFASGYDIRTPKAVEETFKKFDQLIGIDKLKMSHCNDSKIELGGHKDRHEHLGEGLIGKTGFEALLTNKRLQKINYYLETEHDKVREDLQILKDIRNNK
ncbi:MAG: deoxyribonuclease IV [Candidatus Magasanikbacteria bacterium]